MPKIFPFLIHTIPQFSVAFVLWMCFCRSVFVVLFFFICPLYYMSFLEIRLLIAPFGSSSNLSTNAPVKYLYMYIVYFHVVIQQDMSGTTYHTGWLEFTSGVLWVRLVYCVLFCRLLITPLSIFKSFSLLLLCHVSNSKIYFVASD